MSPQRGARAAVTLIYRVGSEPKRYTVAVEWTSARFGGRVPWFRCPAVNCGRRCAILFCSGGIFACRHCHRLAYASQNETSVDRLQRRRTKAWRKLGPEAEHELWADKPKGMHWRRYEQLLNQALELEAEWNHAWMMTFAQRVAARGARARQLTKRPSQPSRRR